MAEQRASLGQRGVARVSPAPPPSDPLVPAPSPLGSGNQGFQPLRTPAVQPCTHCPAAGDRLIAGEAGQGTGREATSTCSASAMGLARGRSGSPLRASSHQPRWERHDHFWCPKWETKASLVTWLDWEVKAHRVSRLLCCGPAAQAQFKAGEERSLVLPTAQPLSVPIVAAWCLGLLTLRCR